MNATEEKPQQINGVEKAASSVRDDSGVNGSGTGSKSGTPLTQARSGHVPMYELIDKDGNWAGSAYDIKWLVKQAKECWPDQEQDEDRTGKGWDIQIAGV